MAFLSVFACLVLFGYFVLGVKMGVEMGVKNKTYCKHYGVAIHHLTEGLKRSTPTVGGGV